MTSLVHRGLLLGWLAIMAFASGPAAAEDYSARAGGPGSNAMVSKSYSGPADGLAKHDIRGPGYFGHMGRKSATRIQKHCPLAEHGQNIAKQVYHRGRPQLADQIDRVCTLHQISRRSHCSRIDFGQKILQGRNIARHEVAQQPQDKVATLGGLIQSYYETEHFKNLAPATRRDYRQCADFLEPIRDTPIHTIDTPLVEGIHDKAAQKIGWRRANMLRTFLSEVFRFAIPKGLISANFATGVIPKPRPAQLAYANRPWEPEECDIVLEHAPPHVRVVLAVLMNTGLDPSDALNLRRDQMDGETIWACGARRVSKWPFPLAPRCMRP